MLSSVVSLDFWPVLPRSANPCHWSDAKIFFCLVRVWVCGSGFAFSSCSSEPLVAFSMLAFLCLLTDLLDCSTRSEDPRSQLAAAAISRLGRCSVCRMAFGSHPSGSPHPPGPAPGIRSYRPAARRGCFLGLGLVGFLLRRTVSVNSGI